MAEHVRHFLRDQYRHCKPILAFGASVALLAEGQIPMTLQDGSADTGLIVADDVDADLAIASLITALGLRRHFGRENDPPMVE